MSHLQGLPFDRPPDVITPHQWLVKRWQIHPEGIHLTCFQGATSLASRSLPSKAWPPRKLVFGSARPNQAPPHAPFKYQHTFFRRLEQEHGITTITCRSPPATFKSPKATRGDLLEGAGMYTNAWFCLVISKNPCHPTVAFTHEASFPTVIYIIYYTYIVYTISYPSILSVSGLVRLFCIPPGLLRRNKTVNMGPNEQDRLVDRSKSTWPTSEVN